MKCDMSFNHKRRNPTFGFPRNILGSLKKIILCLLLMLYIVKHSIVATKITPKLAVIGGGASGMVSLSIICQGIPIFYKSKHSFTITLFISKFASISAGEALAVMDDKNMNCKILVYEGGKKLMTKVAISGGGRVS